MQRSFEITSLSRSMSKNPNYTGHVILANFDAQLGPVLLQGCALVRTPANGLTVWAPSTSSGRRQSVKITDSSMAHQMMMRAREVYRALGGDDAEFIGTAVPEFPGRVSHAEAAE